jgi:DNA polymerase III delta prime subunit
MTFDVRFKNPSTFILAGPSQSGKTTFVLNLLRQIGSFFTTPECQKNIIYYYKEWQELFDLIQAENIIHQWVNEVPSAEDFKARTFLHKNSGGSVVVIDDFAQELGPDVQNIFSVLAHHLNTTVILLTQNIFSKNRVFRDISLNATYIVIFKNPRDASQISHFARQFAPSNYRYIVDAFKECTKSPYSYMLFDHHQASIDSIRVRSHILPKENPMRVWIPKTCP